MKRLITVLVLFVFAVACVPTSDDVGDIVDLQQIEMFQQNDVEEILLEDFTLLITDTGESFIFNGHTGVKVEVDGIMYLHEVPLLGGGYGVIPCTQTMYDNIKSEELILQKSFELISYYKLGDNDEKYHKEVFYRTISDYSIEEINTGKKVAAL